MRCAQRTGTGSGGVRGHRRLPALPGVRRGAEKTATVSFGQPMPQAELQRAFRAARRADLVLAAGSTLEVQPAADVPLAAAGAGARYAIINRGPTAHDRFADLRLEGDVTALLPALVRAVEAALPAAAAGSTTGEHDGQESVGLR